VVQRLILPDKVEQGLLDMKDGKVHTSRRGQEEIGTGKNWIPKSSALLNLNRKRIPLSLI